MTFTFRVVDDFRADIPQTMFAQGAGPWRAIVGHWTVGNPGVAGFASTVTNTIIPSGKPGGRNVSYHEGWCWDADSRTFTVVRIVPERNAAHSCKPKRPVPWNPDQLTRDLLGNKFHDPNRFAYAVAFAGGPTHLAEALEDADFVAGCARRTADLIARFGLPERPIFEHFRGQPGNKSDWGNELTPAIYARLRQGSQEDDVKITRNRWERWRAANGNGVLRRNPVRAEAPFVRLPDGTEISSLAEVQSSDGGNWRLVEHEGVAWFLRSDFEPVIAGGSEQLDRKLAAFVATGEP